MTVAVPEPPVIAGLQPEEALERIHEWQLAFVDEISQALTEIEDFRESINRFPFKDIIATVAQIQGGVYRPERGSALFVIDAPGGAELATANGTDWRYVRTKAVV